MREMRNLATLHPRHVPTLVANAALAYEGGDPVRAQKYLDQALRVDPGHVQATLLRIRIARSSARTWDASWSSRASTEWQGQRRERDNTAVRMKQRDTVRETTQP